MGVRQFGMAEPGVDWRGQAGSLRVFKGHGRKSRERKRGKEEGRLGRHHPLAESVRLRL